MNIACLAWGSLVWNPKDLPIQRRWFEDGPFVPVEFSRQSQDGRITLVIDEDAEPVYVLWTRMTLSDIEKAAKALSEREGITASDWKSRIGKWKAGDAAPKSMVSLPAWAQAHEIDGVIWTALGPQYTRQGETRVTKERPTIDWVLHYLQELTGPPRYAAEQYFRCAPPQIDTEYRRRVEIALGWRHHQC